VLDGVVSPAAEWTVRARTETTFRSGGRHMRLTDVRGRVLRELVG